MTARRGVTRALLFAGAFLFSAVTISTSAPVASAGSMATGGITSQPIGHFEFCRRLPGECTSHTDNKRPLLLTRETFGMISRVNLTVNRSIKPMSDSRVYGQQEHWAYPTSKVGDCEDFALEKRRILMGRGVSAANLLMTVVRKPDGEGHAVLTIRTDGGDFVLDNLDNQVLPWRETGYRFLKRQAEDHSGRWVSIRSGTVPALVSAVRSTTH
ncbi:transglutaminase-like cysteine peptidase [Tianweitania sediminis]|uniref:Transglutaminase-like cysteine peptidase n=1 Tax=Tianweitania sediminis TaxID=1502156 RepID=A0A8J7QXF1_9HYPH|nr:transglutaminase-like cysteine peptidase [Tianweitania sediminis]MBP0437495.1 transglutaminase-like cysteine peptidase [Tianweitania sediminis]